MGGKIISPLFIYPYGFAINQATVAAGACHRTFCITDGFPDRAVPRVVAVAECPLYPLRSGWDGIGTICFRCVHILSFLLILHCPFSFLNNLFVMRAHIDTIIIFHQVGMNSGLILDVGEWEGRTVCVSGGRYLANTFEGV